MPFGITMPVVCLGVTQACTSKSSGTASKPRFMRRDHPRRISAPSAPAPPGQCCYGFAPASIHISMNARSSGLSSPPDGMRLPVPPTS